MAQSYDNGELGAALFDTHGMISFRATIELQFGMVGCGTGDLL